MVPQGYIKIECAMTSSPKPVGICVCDADGKLLAVVSIDDFRDAMTKLHNLELECGMKHADELDSW